MIGWYHTHPGFGIFLSDMDVFICDNFFNLPWQVAFVYDPLGGDEGNFVWRAGQAEPRAGAAGGRRHAGRAAVPLISVREAMAGGDADVPFSDAAEVGPTPLATAALHSQVIELMARTRLLERRVKLLAFAVLALAVFVAVCVTMVFWTAAPPSPARPMPSTAVPSSAAQIVHPHAGR